MNRKWIAVFLCMVLILTLNASTIFASGLQVESMKVVVNGKPLSMELANYTSRGSLLVPLRDLVKSIGGEIVWDGAAQTITVKKGQNTIQFWDGSKEVKVNGVTTNIAAPVQVVKGHTYGPVRFLAETLGLTVQYAAKTKTVALGSSTKPDFLLFGVNQGNVLYTNEVKVSVVALNHELKDFKEHTVANEGEGHIHLWLDTDASTPKDAVKQVFAVPTVFDNVAPGEHTLTVQLVGNDHKPIQPEVKKVITFTTANKPVLFVKGPSEGAVITGSKVTVTTVLQGLKFTDFTSHQQAVVGEGHLHLWLDTDASNAKIAYKQTNSEPVVFVKIVPGNHTLTVQVVGNNHQPIQPEVKQVIHFKTAAAPSLRVVSPKAGETIKGDKVTVKFNISGHQPANFKTQSQPKAGQGHVHLWLDTDASDPTIAIKVVKGNSYTFDNVAAGKHTLTVMLVGNDHKPIQPIVKQVITFNTAANTVTKPSEPAKEDTPEKVTKTYTMDSKDFAFAPETLDIELGSKVIFTNRDEVKHTATSKAGNFDSGLLAKDESYTFTFDKAGEYDIYCKPHPNMKAKIVVK